MLKLLSTLLIVPLLGALLIGFVGRTDRAESLVAFKRAALGITIVEFLIALIAFVEFDMLDAGFQLAENQSWLGSFRYMIGIDGMSMLFVLLTTGLMPIVIGASWNVTHRVKEYFIAFLILETFIIGVFISLDIILFYVFFEASLLPMFLIIGIWGGKDRIYASFKFFLYTLLGSLLMLIAIIYMISVAGSSSIPELMNVEYSAETLSILGIPLSGGIQSLLFLAFFVSFAVKMPMWPVHTWLPDAHVQAPTAGSVILAAILLKMGGYGFLRFSLPMFPEASQIMANFVLILSVIAIVYTSIVAIVQTDMKKLIAYSSVAHMGYVTMGIFSLNTQGLEGAIYQMISHGFISAALFLCVGVIYDRMHTRDIDAFGGLVVRMPVYALIFMFFTMANVGLPGTSGFIGEFLTLLGAFKANTWIAVIATSGVVLSASYALWLYRRVVFGDLIKDSLKSIADVSRLELSLFVPLIALTIITGVKPNLIIDFASPVVENILVEYPNEDVFPDLPETHEEPAHDTHGKEEAHIDGDGHNEAHGEEAENNEGH